MLCYRDMTFCAAKCLNTDCGRNAKHIPEDTEWPVAFADFSEDCPGYQPEDDET